NLTNAAGEEANNEANTKVEEAVVENNETGFSTKAKAESAAKDALLNSKGINNSYNVVQGANGKFFYNLTNNPGLDTPQAQDIGYKTEAEAIKAAKEALANDKVNDGYKIRQTSNGRYS